MRKPARWHLFACLQPHAVCSRQTRLLPADSCAGIGPPIARRKPGAEYPPFTAYWKPAITNCVGPACGLAALKYISYPAQACVHARRSPRARLCLPDAIGHAFRCGGVPHLHHSFGSRAATNLGSLLAWGFGACIRLWRAGVSVSVPAVPILTLHLALQVLAKSSKMIPVMLMGTLLHGKRYSALEYACCLAISGRATMGGGRPAPCWCLTSPAGLHF